MADKCQKNHSFLNKQISTMLIISCLLVSSEDLLCYHCIYYNFQQQTYWTVILQYFKEQVNKRYIGICNKGQKMLYSTDLYLMLTHIKSCCVCPWLSRAPSASSWALPISPSVSNSACLECILSFSWKKNLLIVLSRVLQALYRITLAYAFLWNNHIN